MTGLAIDAHTRAAIAERARQANQAALESPALLAYYLDPTWVIRAHIELMSRHLVDLEAGRCRRLLITTPPQVGKSSLIAEWLPFWWMCKRPRDKIIIGSYGTSLANRRGRVVRRLVREHGWRWDLALEHGATGVAEWYLESGGGLKSVGAGSAVTGSPADLAIIDDPHKNRAEAESLLIRDKVGDWYSADIVSRLSPGAPMVMVLTRWHPDDLAARALEQDGTEDEGGLWRVVRLPAFADSADDPLGRARGEPLPHPKIPEGDQDAAVAHWEDKRRQSLSVRDWYSLYQADPQPSEGALVTAAVMRARRHIPAPVEPQRYAVAVDPSGGGRDLAGVIGGFIGGDQRLYIDTDASTEGYSNEWAFEAALLAAQRRADTIVVERNFGGDQALMAIRSAWDRVCRYAAREGLTPQDDEEQIARCQGLPLRPGTLAPMIKQATAKQGKRLRAEPVAQQIWDDRMRTAAYLPEYEHEWVTWQPGDPDSPGRIDASVYLAYEMLPIPGAETVVSIAVGSRREIAARAARRVNPRARIRRPPIQPW